MLRRKGVVTHDEVQSFWAAVDVEEARPRVDAAVSAAAEWLERRAEPAPDAKDSP